MSDQSILSWFASRSLRLIGLFLVAVSSAALVFMVLLDLIAGLGNPYLGILTYLILPFILVIGLLLVPLDSWLRRRRIAAGRPEYPSIDFNDTHVRRLAAFFIISGALILVVLTVVAYKAIEFMDTVTFCGSVCHRVMDPERTAFIRSSHASVGCVSCHIGPGAPWFVRAKLSGVPQVYHYLTNTYPKPIPTPVAALRPSRDTCENCHWPAEFYGDTLRTTITYRTDRENTQVVRSQILKVGSGGIPGAGIHSHMMKDIYYISAVKDRTVLAWVGVKQRDGSFVEYINPSQRVRVTEQDIRRRARLMDCIDCHNRAAHDFLPFEQLLDMSITRRKIPPDLPYIKREAMEAVGEVEANISESEQRRTLERIERIADFYRREYPAIYKERSGVIAGVVNEVKRVYMDTVFPTMNVGPGTYPNWRTHTGCFRCHGALVAKTGGEVINQDCDFCHSQPVEGALIESLVQQ